MNQTAERRTSFILKQEAYCAMQVTPPVSQGRTAAGCVDGGHACVQRNIRPMIETVPLENEGEALYANHVR